MKIGAVKTMVYWRALIKFFPIFYIFRPIWKQNRYNLKKIIKYSKRSENMRRESNFPLDFYLQFPHLFSDLGEIR